ncbi:hypothetical protein RO3G_11009 [Rhizopus delemar RA 99-880]|uniref:Uncharacterized protein n=1 Tax=Rhizopus delemar (strain RA 99-880 / ATCC MYA-4621 / FGSC 9543 / NRRL 43880) TaxID=246409 RepID=I1CCW8_RHIO9|nr:hypothetical protein RO3G_11009 [Rhizopus delemar RA 99-880]|eukprot:EIE86298.1 hypothetical protein RO3G_11009 [Rhizopus delemar RA 99-880]
MISNQNDCSIYDNLPVLNSWYETEPIHKKPTPCLVTFSSDPPLVHQKRPQFNRRPSSSEAVKGFFKSCAHKLSKQFCSA